MDGFSHEDFKGGKQDAEFCSYLADTMNYGIKVYEYFDWDSYYYEEEYDLEELYWDDWEEDGYTDEENDYDYEEFDGYD